jgi:putative phosphoesterase
MHIAVFSDIHDNIWNLDTALKRLTDYDAELLCFLGDFCAPFTLKQLAEGFPGPVHVVFGNNDGDQFLLGQIAAGFDHVTLHGQFAEVSADGRLIALNHYPDIAKPIAQSGDYDAVFSGHDHKRYVHRYDSCLWANPGEIMGRFGEPSFGVYDTSTDDFVHVDIT